MVGPVVYDIKDNSPIDLGEIKGTHLVVTIAAAFSDTCTKVCVPKVIENAAKLRGAGIGRIIIVSADQPHALKAWMLLNKWENSTLEFASDFGNSELRNEVGVQWDEDENLPPPKGNMLRRSYLLVRDGHIDWQYTEPDTSKVTVPLEELIKVAKGGT